MTINWPLITVLFCLSIPGVYLAMPRLIQLLLPNNTKQLVGRFSRFAVIQTLLMVLILSFAGSVLAQATKLNDPLLDGLLQGKFGLEGFQAILLPTFVGAIIGFIGFCGLYYGFVATILDEHSFKVMQKLRAALGVDGCVLYGGVVEEVIARWGFMNLLVFFLVFFTQQRSSWIMWTAILISGLMLAVGQIPAYIAAGCVASRRFVYSVVVLYLWQSLVFGFLFWQYGLISAILGHMLFLLAWSRYDNVQNLA